MRYRPLRLPVIALFLAVIGACSRASEPLEVATRLPSPKALPEIKLTEAKGQRLTKDQLRGRPTLLFFGFASCPEICPTSLATLAQAVRQLTDLPQSERPRILFVSVDPKRDTPPVLSDFAAHFGTEVLAATGDKAALDQITAAVGAYYRIGPQADPAAPYAVEHSGQVFILDSEASLIALISPPLSPTSIARDVRRLLGHRGEVS
jgi:protein SCO1/2